MSTMSSYLILYIGTVDLAIYSMAIIRYFVKILTCSTVIAT